ncbi:MAG TPA: glycosyltransferase, partial [Acidimicrobiales bacterium]|nr:glycosyltransferase [Acidimicrobiales bacterium]
MEAQVPAVVAVVVTADPGPWFEDTLCSLAAQDYGELSVLVLAVGDDHEEVTGRVGRVLPDAFVRHLADRRGYAAATNEALGMVEGAAFYLLCHDDVALDPDAVHLLVEEAFRSNAGVVSPKFVNWDDPTVLLHVGMSCDKTGAVVDRILEGEVDHGQHDAVRDVFVAPGGCVLVRADLFAELGGFDPGIVAMGEDLDFCWRSQVAGSRVVVAPAARVRHREAVASGLEPLAVGAEPEGRHPVTLQALQRRHELRAVLKCFTWFPLLWVLPEAALLALGEIAVALLARDGERARAVAGAWRWNARRIGEIRALRRTLAGHRLLSDAEVRRLQVRGSARLSRYLSRLSHQGLDAANAVRSGHRHPERTENAEVAVLTGSVGTAFSEDADFDQLDDLGRRAGRDRFGRRVRTPVLGSGRQRIVAVLLALAVVTLGTRELLFGSLPLVGQLAPLPSWSATWHHFFSGWQSAGVGTTAPASPAFGLVGLTSTVLLGAMPVAQRILILGCIPLGAWGLSRFLRPLVSPRARMVGALCYLGLPLAYGALGTGRWDGLVAYALFPFIAARLARTAGLTPFAAEPGPRWRSGQTGQVAILGALIAATAGFAPAVVPIVLVTAVAWEVGALVVGVRQDAGRVVVAALKGVGAALVLVAPWVIGTVWAGKASVGIFGLPISAATAPGWGEVVRFAIGPAARSPLVWLLVVSAALPLLIGRGVRLVWAARLWAGALASWGLALVTSRGDLGSFTPSESVVLAP